MPLEPANPTLDRRINLLDVLCKETSTRVGQELLRQWVLHPLGAQGDIILRQGQVKNKSESPDLPAISN